jgi:hypothetical protein
VSAGDGTKFSLDTNVDPPIPAANQSLAFVDGAGNPVAVRQTELDGSIRPTVPEPASLALVGLLRRPLRPVAARLKSVA